MRDNDECSVGKVATMLATETYGISFLFSTEIFLLFCETKPTTYQSSIHALTHLRHDCPKTKDLTHIVGTRARCRRDEERTISWCRRKMTVKVGLCDSTWFRTTPMQSTFTSNGSSGQQNTTASTRWTREEEEEEKLCICVDCRQCLCRIYRLSALKMRLPSTFTRTTHALCTRRSSSIWRREEEKIIEKFNTLRKWRRNMVRLNLVMVFSTVRKLDKKQ